LKVHFVLTSFQLTLDSFLDPAAKYCNWKSRKDGLREAFTEDGKLISYADGKDKRILLECNKKLEPHLLARVEGYRLPTDAEWEYAAKVCNFCLSL